MDGHDQGRWTEDIYYEVTAQLEDGKSLREIAAKLGVPRSTLYYAYRDMKAKYGPGVPTRHFKENKEQGEATCEVTTSEFVKTEADAIRVAGVDLSIWYVHSWECRQWTTPLNVKQGQRKVKLTKTTKRYDGKEHKTDEEMLKWLKSKPIQQQQYLVALKLRRKCPEILSVESLLKELSGRSIQLPTFRTPKVTRCHTKLALEVSLMDPHLGLRCFQPQADTGWSLEEAEQAFAATALNLLEKAKQHGPFEEIVAPIGNDYFHADSILHTTTGGTPQPEMESLHQVYLHGEKLMFWYIERLREICPNIKLYSIPGNHDRWTTFTMARLVKAFYTGAKINTVQVDASPSPYKFWAYGVNLIGFEHGHSVDAIRLGALMANETRRTHWANARYCEWHLGDQHRKGTGKPSTMEEQGVSIEYLPSLTPPNEWHRLKSFNWQKRGGMAWIYDKAAGPVARLQVNFDSYTGKHMGVS